MPHPLDNPIWSALTTEQAHLAHGNGLARRFPCEISPLTSLEAPPLKPWPRSREIMPAGELTIFPEANPEFSSDSQIIELNSMPQMVYVHEEVPPTSIDFI